MKIKATKSVETEIEITFPYYFKRCNFNYAALNETTSIECHTGGMFQYHTETVIGNSQKPDAIEITKAEFEKAFDAEVQRFAKLLTSF